MADWFEVPVTAKLNSILTVDVEIVQQMQRGVQFVQDLRAIVGSLVQFDIATTVKPECQDLGNKATPNVIAAAALLIIVVLINLRLLLKYYGCQPKVDRVKQAGRAHVLTYGLALYSLSFPLLATQTVRWLDWTERTETGLEGNWKSNQIPHVTHATTGGMITAVTTSSA